MTCSAGQYAVPDEAADLNVRDGRIRHGEPLPILVGGSSGLLQSA